MFNYLKIPVTILANGLLLAMSWSSQTALCLHASSLSRTALNVDSATSRLQQ